MALFRAAKIIVGVHGGALANIVACESGTKLIELGFQAPFTMHYAHAAAALGLEYELVLLDIDPLGRGVGAKTVTVGDTGRKRIIASIFETLSQAKTTCT